MLALDRRILDTPFEQRQLESQTTDLVALAKTMFLVIRHSISGARKQLLSVTKTYVPISLTRQHQSEP
jgi:hypothetical protein